MLLWLVGRYTLRVYRGRRALGEGWSRTNRVFVLLQGMAILAWAVAAGFGWVLALMLVGMLEIIERRFFAGETGIDRGVETNG